MLPGLLTELFRSVIILEQLIGFLLQETKMFSVGIRQNGMNLQIFETLKQPVITANSRHGFVLSADSKTERIKLIIWS